MSLLTKTEASVTALPDTIASLRTQLRSLFTSLTSPSPPSPASLSSSLSTLRTSALTLRTEASALDRAVHRFVTKAKDPDPDHNPYNAVTVRRIIEMGRRWDEGKAEVDAVVAEVEADWQQAEERRRKEEERIKAEVEETRRKAEEEKRKQEEDSKRKAEENERRRKEDEQRKAEEERHRIDLITKQKQEAEAAAQAEAQRKKEEAERKQKEETERKAKAEADRIIAEGAERLRVAEEEARKPPLTRAKESLTSALSLLSSSCTVQSDHVIALQMLLKFVSQIVSNPHDAKYRRVNVLNPIIRQRLMGKKGGSEALQAIGFRAGGAAGEGGAVEGKDGEEWSIQASADAWTIITQAKTMLETELREVQAGRRRTPTAPPATTTPPSSSPAIASPTPPLRPPAPPAATPTSLPAVPAATADAFALFSQMFSPGASAGTATATGQTPVPPVNPLPSMLGQSAIPASPSAAAPHPFAVMNDPLFQTLLSNPRLMQAMMGGGGGGGNPAELMRVMSEEIERNPQLLSAMMSSPLLSSFTTRAPPAAGIAGVNPFAAMLGMQRPVASTAAASTSQSSTSLTSNASAASSSGAASPATAASSSSASTSAIGSAGNVSVSAASAPMDAEELSEDQLLEQALAMSMQTDDQPMAPDNNKDGQDK